MALAPLSFAAVVFGIESGIVGAVIFFGLGVMGMLGALRLGKTEKFLAAQSESSRATG